MQTAARPGAAALTRPQAVAVGTLAPLDVLQAETNIARTEERILVVDNALRAQKIASSA